MEPMSFAQVLLERDRVAKGCSEFNCLLTCACADPESTHVLIKQLAALPSDQFRLLVNALNNGNCVTCPVPQQGGGKGAPPAPVPPPPPPPPAPPGPDPVPPGPPDPVPTATCVDDLIEKICTEEVREAVLTAIPILLASPDFPLAHSIGLAYEDAKHKLCSDDHTMPQDEKTVKAIACGLLVAIAAAAVLYSLPKVLLDLYNAFAKCCNLPPIQAKPPLDNLVGPGNTQPTSSSGATTLPVAPTATQDSTEDGAALGAALGTIAGAAIGAMAGGVGAPVGGALGGAIGGKLGGWIDGMMTKQVAPPVAHAMMFHALREHHPRLTGAMYSKTIRTVMVSEGIRRQIPINEVQRFLPAA